MSTETKKITTELLFDEDIWTVIYERKKRDQVYFIKLDNINVYVPIPKHLIKKKHSEIDMSLSLCWRIYSQELEVTRKFRI